MNTPCKPNSSKIGSYINGVFSYDRVQHAIELRVRARIKWILDYVRNVMIVGVFLYLGRTTDNTFLTYSGYAGCAFLFVYLMSYIEPLAIRPFHPLQNQRLAYWLDFVFFMVVVAPIALGVQFGLVHVVKLISDAYLGR